MSTNHPLMNSVKTAFIALRAGEKCVHVGLAVTRMLNGKDTAEGWNPYTVFSGWKQSLYFSVPLRSSAVRAVLLQKELCKRGGVLFVASANGQNDELCDSVPQSIWKTLQGRSGKATSNPLGQYCVRGDRGIQEGCSL